MNKRFNLLLYVCTIGLLVIQSCSEGSVISPCLEDHPTDIAYGSNERLSGIWDIAIDPVTGEASAVPLRNAEFACNVTRFLQPPIAPINLLSVTIEPGTDFPKGLVIADIGLTHPFSGLDFYTGFDVRGVVIGDGSISSQLDPDLRWAGPDDLQLLNPDGLTRWFNPSEFTTYGKLFGFTLGVKGTQSSDFTATLNGYKYYCAGLDETAEASDYFGNPDCDNPRGYFAAGAYVARRYVIQFPMPGNMPLFHFQYAIVASWVPPDKNPPKTIPEDFSISANCSEAFAISVTDLSDMYYTSDIDKGGILRLSVRVFDHQGAVNPSGIAGEIAAILFETPEGPISGNVASFDQAALGSAIVAQDELSATFLLEVGDLELTKASGFPLMISVESASPNTYSSGFSGFDYPETGALSAYWLDSVRVLNTTKGWVRTWGGVTGDSYSNMTVDNNGYIYISGWFSDTVDFDPGPGVDVHTAIAYCDIFLSKFDPGGNLLWTRTWGGDYWDSGHSVAVDSIGNVYVAGVFLGTVDFDPGPGEDERTSNGYADAFLSKFSTNGDYLWTQAWGGVSEPCDYAEGMCVDGNGDAYVTGKFVDTVDFDPGPGVSVATSNGLWDVYLTKFDADGGFLWARTWGGTGWDAGWVPAVDQSGNCFIGGWFNDSVDFDTGPLDDVRTSNGGADAFLTKLDSDGGFAGAWTWGGPENEECKGVAVSGSGLVYMTGYFGGTADLDPTSGEMDFDSNGGDDVFLIELDPDGPFGQKVETWGGTEEEYGTGVSVDSLGNVYVAGYFQSTVDFDPGSTVDEHSSYGQEDAFLCRFLPDSKYEWTRTWGGVGLDHCAGAAFDSVGNIYLPGSLEDTVDFDPGSGTEFHSSNGENDIFLLKMRPDGSW